MQHVRWSWAGLACLGMLSVGLGCQLEQSARTPASTCKKVYSHVLSIVDAEFASLEKAKKAGKLVTVEAKLKWTRISSARSYLRSDSGKVRSSRGCSHSTKSQVVCALAAKSYAGVRRCYPTKAPKLSPSPTLKSAVGRAEPAPRRIVANPPPTLLPAKRLPPQPASPQGGKAPAKPVQKAPVVRVAKPTSPRLLKPAQPMIMRPRLTIVQPKAAARPGKPIVAPAPRLRVVLRQAPPSQVVAPKQTAPSQKAPAPTKVIPAPRRLLAPSSRPTSTRAATRPTIK